MYLLGWRSSRVKTRIDGELFLRSRSVFLDLVLVVTAPDDGAGGDLNATPLKADLGTGISVTVPRAALRQMCSLHVWVSLRDFSYLLNSSREYLIEFVKGFITTCQKSLTYQRFHRVGFCVTPLWREGSKFFLKKVHEENGWKTCKHFSSKPTWKPAALIYQQADPSWLCGWSKHHYLASFGLDLNPQVSSPTQSSSFCFFTFKDLWRKCVFYFQSTRSRFASMLMPAPVDLSALVQHTRLRP